MIKKLLALAAMALLVLATSAAAAQPVVSPGVPGSETECRHMHVYWDAFAACLTRYSVQRCRETVPTQFVSEPRPYTC